MCIDIMSTVWYNEGLRAFSSRGIVSSQRCSSLIDREVAVTSAIEEIMLSVNNVDWSSIRGDWSICVYEGEKLS